MVVIRKIDTLEGALRDAIEKFGVDKIATEIGKSRDYLTTLSNPNQKQFSERRQKNITHNDSIAIDKYCLTNDMAPPMIAVHQMILDEYRSNLNQSKSIEESINNISFRFSEVLTRVEESIDPKSEKGIEFSDTEKKHINKSIKELEEHLIQFKNILK